MPHSPVLSVICLTLDSLRTLDALFSALTAQTMAERLEIVLLAPAFTRDEALSFRVEQFACMQRLDIDPALTNPQLRALGVAAASSAYVVFTEDHCFPSPGWAAALVRELDTGALGAGPMMQNANPDNPTSWANFLLEYGAWSHASLTGPSRHLPGHNSAYRRDALLALGDRLPQVLQLESPWLYDETARGARVVCVAAARSYHFNFATTQASLPVRFLGGRVYGSTRAASWGLLRRIAYAGALPLIVAVRWPRVIEQARQVLPGPITAQLRWQFLLLLVVGSLGEVWGYLTGIGNASVRLTGLEFHRERFTAGTPVVPPTALFARDASAS